MKTHRWQDIKNRGGRISAERMAEIEADVAAEVSTFRALREELGLTQADLAKLANMTQGEVSRFEQREDHRISNLRDMVEALGGKLEVTAVLGDKRYVSMSDCRSRARSMHAAAQDLRCGERGPLVVRSVQRRQRFVPLRFFASMPHSPSSWATPRSRASRTTCERVNRSAPPPTRAARGASSASQRSRSSGGSRTAVSALAMVQLASLMRSGARAGSRAKRRSMVVRFQPFSPREGCPSASSCAAILRMLRPSARSS